MRYIDSGTRDPADALGAWLLKETANGVAELRWQSGFFSIEGLAPLVPALQHSTKNALLVRAVIGSNDGDTLIGDLDRLVTLMGLPRPTATLGVVSYSGAYFHPKTYHLTRTDGSQAAYVGSANLTLAGMSSLHVEAGLILDTADGDPTAVLDQIAQSVDIWFAGSPIGLEMVTDSSDVARLAAKGIVRAVRPPRLPSANSAANGIGTPRPRLKALVAFPPVPGSLKAVGPANTPQTSSNVVPPPVLPITSSATALLSSVPQSPPYPAYVLFAPGATQATSGASALSGSALPGGNVGLVIRLNRDSARHWLGNSGTANVSIPVPTVSTLRFGMFQRKYSRPRVEFNMEMRYIGATGQFVATTTATNIMLYGFAPGESGHGDVRMIIPAAPAREINGYANGQSLPVPRDGDVALLEWPTANKPVFRLTVIDNSLPLFAQATSMLASASANNQLVGQGACWLPAGFSPVW